MAKLKCPICRKPFDSAQSPAMPFCSERCQLVDLHRWLGEAYSLPSEREAEAEPDEQLDDE
jgi:endogenous inhibitor of DNA gyrase (YacG/DUF329 family)